MDFGLADCYLLYFVVFFEVLQTGMLQFADRLGLDLGLDWVSMQYLIVVGMVALQTGHLGSLEPVHLAVLFPPLRGSGGTLRSFLFGLEHHFPEIVLEVELGVDTLGGRLETRPFSIESSLGPMI